QQTNETLQQKCLFLFSAEHLSSDKELRWHPQDPLMQKWFKLRKWTQATDTQGPNLHTRHISVDPASTFFFSGSLRLRGCLFVRSIRDQSFVTNLFTISLPFR